MIRLRKGCVTYKKVDKVFIHEIKPWTALSGDTYYNIVHNYIFDDMTGVRIESKRYSDVTTPTLRPRLMVKFKRIDKDIYCTCVYCKRKNREWYYRPFEEIPQEEVFALLLQQ